jgi:hypothetical protein
MRWLFSICGLWLSVGPALGQMVLNNAIGNDPARERLCIARALAGNKGKSVPFEIDLQRVTSARSVYPDVTFVAIEYSISTQLIECTVNAGTGVYGPLVSLPEGGGATFWHLITPPQFSPGINTQAGGQMAGNRCREAAAKKINRPNFDHSVFMAPGGVEIGIGHYGRYYPGMLIGGKEVKRYDIVTTGTAFYKSLGPDLTAVQFTCLFSPMLEIKAIQLK